MEKSKMIVILGQTSTGKSDFAVNVARKINGINQTKRLATRTSQGEVLGEIVSADSRQVYKGMNLGTGKITKKEMSGVKHHLLDVVSPKTIFSVSDFQKLAKQSIAKIISKKKIPIICGGTAFYIDSLINNQNYPNVKPNKKLRKELNKKTAEELFIMLKKLDKVRANNIDSKNKVRLIRAIEIATQLGKVPKISKEIKNENIMKIGLTLPPEILKDKIKNRLLSRIKKGMIQEVNKLHKDGVSWKRMNDLGLEYRYVSMYLQKKMTKEEMIEKLYTEIWHFAKRQKTWWKRDKEIIWIDPRDKKSQKETLNKIEEFLKK